MDFHKPRLLLAIVLLLGLAACSSLSFVYRNAPTLAVWWVDRALDLPVGRREALAEAAQETHAWHLGGARLELVAILREADRRLAASPGEADGLWLIERLQAHAREVGGHFALALAPRLPPFSPDELAQVRRRLAKRLAEDRREAFEGGREAALARRADTVVETADEWLGSVSEAQRRLIEASPAVTGFDAGLWLDERARRQARLLEALQASDGGVALREWLTDWRSGRSEEVSRAIAGQRLASVRMWLALWQEASPAQREHLHERLRHWARMIDEARA